MLNNTLKLLQFIEKDSKKIDLKKSNICGIINLLDFFNLEVLNIENNRIIELKGLSKSIIYINCSYNELVYLENLPDSLEELDCSYNLILNLNYLPNSLLVLNCSLNQIINLNNLPLNIIKLNCSNNKLVSLEKLPNTIEELDCSYNSIVNLDWLPESLKILNAICNQYLSDLNNLPNSLEKIIFSGDNIDFSIIPKNLKEIYCSSNKYNEFIHSEFNTNNIKIKKLISFEDCIYSNLC